MDSLLVRRLVGDIVGVVVAFAGHYLDASARARCVHPHLADCSAERCTDLESALSWTIEWLQQQSAITARVMFRVAGVPVTQDGIMLSIPGLDIEVARECSSIRSSLMLVITTMVLAHVLLRSWWRKSLLIAVAIPLSFVKNGFRIFVIAELGTRVDPGFLDGRLHRQGGDCVSQSCDRGSGGAAVGPATH